MRKVSFIVVGLVLFGLVGYAWSEPQDKKDANGPAKPKDLIVGKWKMVESVGGKQITVVTEFTSDGTLKVTPELPKEVMEALEKAKNDGQKVPDLTQTGKYKFIDDKTIEIEILGLKDKSKIETLTKEKLVFTEEKDGKVKKTEMTRIP